MTAPLQVGDRIGPLAKPPIDLVQIVKYAGASGDFNRIHYDEAFARSGGYPKVFAQGMLSMGFLGELLSRRFGPAAVRSLQARFKAITWIGEAVTARGEVTALREEGGERLAEIRLWTETPAGTVTIEGRATVALR